MNLVERIQPDQLENPTASFTLSAVVTVLFNTALALAKDVYGPLNNAMKSLTGHHWTTHGLADLLVFLALGLIFMKTGLAEKIEPNRLITLLVGAVTVSGLALLLWYAVV